MNHLFIHPPIFSSIYPSLIIHLFTQPSSIEIIHPPIRPTFHQSPIICPSIIHHTDVCVVRDDPDVYVYGLWRNLENPHTDTRRTWELHIGQEHRIQPTTCWPWGELVSVEMCVGRHLRKHLSQSTVLTVWILQALTVRHSTCGNNSRIWAEPQQEQNRIVQVKHLLDAIQSSFVVQQSASFNQNLWTHIRASLVECEAGVLIATVSLFGAAGGVVLTAVAPDSWCWKTMPFILDLDWTQTALKLFVFVAAWTQTDHRWHSSQRQEKMISLLNFRNNNMDFLGHPTQLNYSVWILFFVMAEVVNV